MLLMRWRLWLLRIAGQLREVYFGLTGRGADGDAFAADLFGLCALAITADLGLGAARGAALGGEAWSALNAATAIAAAVSGRFRTSIRFSLPLTLLVADAEAVLTLLGLLALLQPVGAVSELRTGSTIVANAAWVLGTYALLLPPAERRRRRVPLPERLREKFAALRPVPLPAPLPAGR